MNYLNQIASFAGITARQDGTPKMNAYRLRQRNEKITSLAITVGMYVAITLVAKMTSK